MKNSLTYIFAVCILFIVFSTSCTKYDGYYNFENTEKLYNGNIVSYLESKNGDFDSLLRALDRVPYLKEALKKDSLTLFAPTNITFSNALNNLNLVRSNQQKNNLSIATLNAQVLDTLLTKYIVKNIITTDSMAFTDGLKLNTYSISHPMNAQRRKLNASGLIEGGMELVSFSDTKGNNFETQWVRVNTQAVNILTTNGLVHVLGTRHEFGFGDFLTKMNK